MISRERVLAVVKNEKPDRVPYDITPYGNGLSGYNRQAAAHFRKATGSEDPDAFLRWKETSNG